MQGLAQRVQGLVSRLVQPSTKHVLGEMVVQLHVQLGPLEWYLLKVDHKDGPK